MSSRLSMLVVLLLLELMLLSLWLRLLRGCVKAPYQVWCPVRDQNDSEFQQQCQSKMCHKECGGIQSTHTMQESRKSVMQRNRRARSVLLRNNTFWPHSPPDLVMKTSEEGSFFFALTGAHGMTITVCSSIYLLNYFTIGENTNFRKKVRFSCLILFIRFKLTLEF